MSEDGKVQVPWSEIDTLLLDMDGTLLDLAFDNFFWLELVPQELARHKGVGAEAARREMHERYSAVVGTLPWYCVDHWTMQLGLDIRALKLAHRHLIRYLPAATAFLDAAQSRNKRLVLVTNAHRATLAIKAEATGVDAWMDVTVSSHDYAVPKENPEFWSELERREAVVPARSLLIEDSLAVLETAARSGIAHTIAIRRPDSTQGRREISGFAAVDGVADLI